jgi:hypothetical protein
MGAIRFRGVWSAIKLACFTVALGGAACGGGAADTGDGGGVATLHDLAGQPPADGFVSDLGSTFDLAGADLAGADLANPDLASSPSAEVHLQADCGPVFQDLIVATNTISFDSLGVTNASAPTSGSFQIQLVSGKRQLTLSTSERTTDKDVINIEAGGVIYTNLCNSSPGGCTYNGTVWSNDPIAGSADVKEYDPHTGKLDVTLTGVVLQSSQSLALCHVSGTIKATRLGR